MAIEIPLIAACNAFCTILRTSAKWGGLDILRKFANLRIIVYLCGALGGICMVIKTSNKGLADLLQYGKSREKELKSLPKGVIEGFLKAVRILRAVQTIEELYQYNSLNYEGLSGGLKGYESVRCNRKYRLIFSSRKDNEDIEITVVNLIKISNHYGDL